MMVKMLKVTVWVMAPCGIAGGYQQQRAICSSKMTASTNKTKQHHKTEDQNLYPLANYSYHYTG
jgi:ascorbate-specific PTS system EIIC-type component UlaA